MPTIPAWSLRTQGWAGGANSRDAFNFMTADQSRPIENMVLNERGGGQKRLGCESHGTFGVDADRALSMYTFYRTDANPPQILMYTSAGTLYYTTNPVDPLATWTQIATGLSTSVPFSYETFNSKVYMGNGIDAYCSWDGATYTTYPSAPKGKFVRLWKDTMWISGVTNLPDRVYSSAPGDAETFPVAGYVDVSRGDGDVVRALATDGQFLIVGKRDRTITIYDPNTLANRVVDYEKGFESHFGVAELESEIYFVSRRGICRYLGDSPSQIISDMLDPMFDPQVVALNRLIFSTAYAFENRVGFAISEVGTSYNTVVVEYYPRLGPLTAFGTRSLGPFSYHRMPVQCFAKWRWQGDDILVAGHNNANKFLRLFANVGVDDGKPFKAVMQTPFFDLNDAMNVKYLRRLRLLCSGKFNLFIYRNYDTSIYRTIPVDATAIQDWWDIQDDIWDSANQVWGHDQNIKDILKTNIDAYGRCFSFRFEDASETTTNVHNVWVGDNNAVLPMGEWAIYQLAGEGSMLGHRP
jgi:hypothetical protein